MSEDLEEGWSRKGPWRGKGLGMSEKLEGDSTAQSQEWGEKGVCVCRMRLYMAVVNSLDLIRMQWAVPRVF